MTHIISTLALALSAVFLTPAASAIDRQAQAQVHQRYKAEQALCLSGRSNQSLQTCLREAEAARAQALRADLDDGTSDYVRNAGRRCDALPSSHREDCVARMRGAGTVSGSAAAGGIYRELVTTEPVEPEKAPAGR